MAEKAAVAAAMAFPARLTINAENDAVAALKALPARLARAPANDARLAVSSLVKVCDPVNTAENADAAAVSTRLLTLDTTPEKEAVAASSSRWITLTTAPAKLAIAAVNVDVCTVPPVAIANVAITATSVSAWPYVVVAVCVPVDDTIATSVNAESPPLPREVSVSPYPVIVVNDCVLPKLFE